MVGLDFAYSYRNMELDEYVDKWGSLHFPGLGLEQHVLLGPAILRFSLEANVDFSGLTFVDGGGFLVKSDSPINKTGDMAGKKIAVLAGTTTEQRLRDTLARRNVAGTVVPITNANEGVAMLENGSVDAYAGDKIKLVGLAAQAKDPKKIAMLAEDLSIEPYAFALPRGDSALRLEVNRGLTQVYMGGAIEGIYAQWLGPLGRPSGLLAAMYLLYSIPD